MGPAASGADAAGVIDADRTGVGGRVGVARQAHAAAAGSGHAAAAADGLHHHAEAVDALGCNGAAVGHRDVTGVGDAGGAALEGCAAAAEAVATTATDALQHHGGGIVGGGLDRAGVAEVDAGRALVAAGCRITAQGYSPQGRAAEAAAAADGLKHHRRARGASAEHHLFGADRGRHGSGASVAACGEGAVGGPEAERTAHGCRSAAAAADALGQHGGAVAAGGRDAALDAEVEGATATIARTAAADRGAAPHTAHQAAAAADRLGGECGGVSAAADQGAVHDDAEGSTPTITADGGSRAAHRQAGAHIAGTAAAAADGLHHQGRRIAAGGADTEQAGDAEVAAA